jgi:hypothetical protein
MPGWARVNPVLYWSAADEHERQNGRLFKEVEFALPIELSIEEQILLAQRFAERLTDEGLPYTLAIHAGKGKNPHCHLMISERINDAIERPAAVWFKRHNAKQPEQGGAKKTATLKRKEWLLRIREAWAHLANHALEAAGFAVRIDHRTLEAQGENRLPQIHLGPNVIEMEEKGLATDRADRALAVAEANRQLAEQQAQLKQIEKEFQNEQRNRPRDPRPQSAENSRVAAAAPSSQSENRSLATPGVGHGPRPEKAPATAPAARSKKPTRPTLGPVNQPKGDPDMMNLSPAEQQEFLRVRRRLAAQQQAETEARQRRLTEAQKQRFAELEELAAEAERTRQDHRYLDHDFAWGCLHELRQQRQTVETADWRKTESRVATQMLQNGASLEDVAGLVFDLGMSATTGNPIPVSALQHLQNLALSSPDLADAMRGADQREKEEKQRQPAHADTDEDHHKQSFPKLGM